MESRGNFFFAQVGASSALAGLILIVSTLALVPAQGTFIFGVERLAVGASAWIGLMLVQWRSWQRTTPIYRSSFALRIPLVQIATLACLVAGFGLVTRGLDGVYWLDPSFVTALWCALMSLDLAERDQSVAAAWPENRRGVPPWWHAPRQAEKTDSLG